MGQSVDVCGRIKAHCGFGTTPPDLLGEFIHTNYPASSKWKVDLLSLDECELIARHYFPETIVFDVDIIEQALIVHFGPCFNMFHNTNNPNRMPIPEKYNKSCIPEKINNSDLFKKNNQEKAYRGENARISPTKKSLKSLSSNKNIFQNYRKNLSQNTITSQKASLNIFQDYLVDKKFVKSDKKQFSNQSVYIKEIFTLPSFWKNISGEIIENFIEWLLDKGYAVSSINVKISHIRKYANLAYQVGVIPIGNWERIKEINNISKEKAKIIEKKRDNELILSPKNLKHKVGKRNIIRSIKITEEKARMLKSFPSDNAMGRRNNLIMCLLLDHGLKSQDIACLKSELVDIDLGVFYLDRTNKSKQTHKMTSDTFDAIKKVFDFYDINIPGPLIVRRKRIKTDSKFYQKPLSRSSFWCVINAIGESAGVDNLTEKDCRVYWVSKSVRSGSSLYNLQRSGGWNSIQSVLSHFYEIESVDDNQEDIQDSE